MCASRVWIATILRCFRTFLWEVVSDVPFVSCVSCHRSVPTSMITEPYLVQTQAIRHAGATRTSLEDKIRMYRMILDNACQTGNALSTRRCCKLPTAVEFLFPSFPCRQPSYPTAMSVKYINSMFFIITFHPNGAYIKRQRDRLVSGSLELDLRTS